MEYSKDIYILAIESSCDETSVSIVKNGTEDIATVINSQIDIHKNYGGVVPEIASRMHTENITMVLEETLHKAKMKMEEIDAVAVSYKPGLLGSLLVGVEFAKTLSFVYKKPLIGVNHLIGHIYANNLEDNLEFPLLALVVSGGHTELVIMKDDYTYELLGKTMDDAIGEAFDKVARVLGMPYPGGPNVENAAKDGLNIYKLPKPVDDNTYNFSYSGLKSAIINLVNTEKMKGREIRKEDLACSFQTVAIEELERKLRKALKSTGIKRVVIAGGVSANNYLKSRIERVCIENKAKLYKPRLLYCTDNGAMIGAAAYPLYLKKEFKDLSLNPESEADIC
jgi:N6-L-threonylcarbamoyladenine synthase